MGLSNAQIWPVNLRSMIVTSNTTWVEWFSHSFDSYDDNSLNCFLKYFLWFQWKTFQFSKLKYVGTRICSCYKCDEFLIIFRKNEDSFVKTFFYVYSFYGNVFYFKFKPLVFIEFWERCWSRDLPSAKSKSQLEFTEPGDLNVTHSNKVARCCCYQYLEISDVHNYNVNLSLKRFFSIWDRCPTQAQWNSKNILA